LAPFSIHNIAEEGYKIDRKPGDWYGPQAISIVLKRLNKIYQPVDRFKMHVCLDGNIYLDRIEEKSENWTNSVFVVLPLRLGLNTILPEYLESVKKIFSISQNVGIAGGKDYSALYFIGLTDLTDNLIYLDPHIV
jgi:cysteine protease ATG4